MQIQHQEHKAAALGSSAHFIKAIPTYYNGIKFRSRLEAKYASFFDEFGMKWLYEVEGYNLDGLWYLPDFWLPEIKTFFEVKGILADLEKPKKLASALDDDWVFPKILVLIGDSNGSVIRAKDDDSSISLSSCGACNRYWLYPEQGSYECRACGKYEGDHHLSDTIICHDLPRVIRSSLRRNSKNE